MLNFNIFCERGEQKFSGKIEGTYLTQTMATPLLDLLSILNRKLMPQTTHITAGESKLVMLEFPSPSKSETNSVGVSFFSG